jgi:membrane protein YdbS with pleckstrin-like domain
MQLRDPAHLVSPRAIVFWTVRAVPGWLLLLAGQSLWFVVAQDHVALRVAALALTVVCAAAHLIVMPPWRYRVHRWEVTDNAVYTQSGWLTQERRIAPISRVQTVEARLSRSSGWRTSQSPRPLPPGRCGSMVWTGPSPTDLSPI